MSISNGSFCQHVFNQSSAARDKIAKLDKRLEGNQNNQEFEKIADWLSPLNFLTTQVDVHSKRQEGTGQWLLESQVFKDWLCGTQETLWCPGIREFQTL